MGIKDQLNFFYRNIRMNSNFVNFTPSTFKLLLGPMVKIFTPKLTIILLTLLLALFTKLAVAQSLYTGGSGGGYDATLIGPNTQSQLDSISNPNISISIFPNPLRMGQNLQVRYSGNEVGSPLVIDFTDILGNAIYQTETHAQKRFELSIPTELFRTGFYLVSFSTRNQKVTLRLSLIN